jgi:nucleoside-diphosphate-sugar epimerase
LRVLITGGSGLVGRFVVERLKSVFDLEVLDIVAPQKNDVPFHNVDLLNYNAAAKVIDGFDAVVHLAGVPHPLEQPAERVFRVNVVGTYNVLEACYHNSIGKFVFMSSESTLGFAFAKQENVPLYVPVDEEHPLRPQDPYGLSKVAAEIVCQGFSRRGNIQCIALRAPWIWVPVPKEIEFYKSLVANYHQWQKNLWAYIHVYDVAEAIRLSVINQHLPAYDAFFITADENWTGRESVGLVESYFPKTHVDKNALVGSLSLISSAKAKRVLAFHPTFSRRDLF